MLADQPNRPEGVVTVMVDGPHTNRRPRSTSLERALELLEAFPSAEAPVPLKELARRAGMPASTVHRLLESFAKHGFVENNGRGAYRLGIRLWELGSRVVRQRGLTPLMGSYLERLVSEAGETGHVSVLDVPDVVYVGRVAGARSVSVTSYLGQRVPALCTATGKALCSRQPKSIVDDLIARGLPAYNPLTCTDEGELRARLKQAREDGFVVNLGEWQEEQSGVAAPVTDHTGLSVASIGIAGPSFRYSTEEWVSFGPLVRSIAQEFSRELGAGV